METMSDKFDKTKFQTLADEFGGLAGWYAKENGGWSREKVVQALLRLFDKQHLLDGVEGREERGAVALGAMTENPYGTQIELAEKMFNERNVKGDEAKAA